jgi:hypothetical protein
VNLIRVAALLASITDDLATGAKLSPSQAAAIEASVAQNKAPLPDRLRLLGWYAAQPEPAHRDKRIALILALAQQGALGRLATHTAANISREASPEGYAKVKAVLLARAEKSKLPVDRSNAAWFVFPAEPDEAIRITAENGLMRDTAVLAAQYLLGVVHPDPRSSPFGRSLRQLASETPDPLFQFAFGHTLRDLGARLYATGKTEWDYTALANEALARAAKAEPQQGNCGFDPAVLPARGSVPPIKPSAAPTSGEVTFYALVGCSGYAASLEWLDGPAEGVSAAKREIAARTLEIPGTRQSLQVVSAGRKAR